MAMRCMNCNKGVMYGHNVSHAKNRTRKVFKPNLHVAHVGLTGNKQKVKLCTGCLRMYKKVEKSVRQAQDEKKAALVTA